MSRIVHLSDLHFGRDRAELRAHLIEYVNGLSPDLVIVSGDLTQRARKAQFDQAGDFLDAFDTEVLTVPGNHDIPLDNPWLRFLRPYSRYKKAISRDLEPVADLPDALAVGMNTADAFAWQRGKLRSSSLRKACHALETTKPEGGLGLAVMHHPPEQDKDAGKRPMRGRIAGLMQLQACGADIVLCGHLHTWRVMPVRIAEGLLLVQAGTGLSTRMRGEPNDLNVIDIKGKTVTIDRHALHEGQSGFEPFSRLAFSKPSAVWRMAK